MKILFVALATSIHTARWIRQLGNEGHEIHLFCPREGGWLHPDLRDYVIYHPQVTSSESGSKSVGLPMRLPMLREFTVSWLRRLSGRNTADRLEALVERLRPDIVHSLEFQTCSYLTAVVKERMGKRFPRWMVFSWGSDISMYGRLPEHRRRLKAVLSNCDVFFSDCRRDVPLAKALGMRDIPCYIFPGGGGFALKEMAPLRSTRPSQRKRILVKGYQNWAGRSLFALRAIEMIAHEIQDYEVVIFSCSPDVELKARLLAEDTGLAVRLAPDRGHLEMMKLYGQARVTLALSISDGLPNVFLEAMIMGSFPIQSFTSCADEWVLDESTALLVPAENPQEVAKALLRALRDDALVDEAARLNAIVVSERLDAEQIRQQVQAIYRDGRTLADHSTNQEG